jgi:hypothetical protein
VDPPHEPIASFLQRHPDDICVGCLADAIDLPPSQVSMALQRLTFAGALTARLAICSRCQQRRTVVSAATSFGNDQDRPGNVDHAR